MIFLITFIKKHPSVYLTFSSYYFFLHSKQPPSFSSQPNPPSSPGFRPGNSPGPGNTNYGASSEFGGNVPSSRVYATPAHSSQTPSQGGASSAARSGGLVSATPLPRADLGTKQRSSVRGRSRQRGPGQLSPADANSMHSMAPPSSPFSVAGSEARRRHINNVGGYSPVPPSSNFGATPGGNGGNRTPFNAGTYLKNFTARIIS